MSELKSVSTQIAKCLGKPEHKIVRKSLRTYLRALDKPMTEEVRGEVVRLLGQALEMAGIRTVRETIQLDAKEPIKRSYKEIMALNNQSKLEEEKKVKSRKSK